MKLSTYGFKDLARTYSVIQFEDEEVGVVVEKLKNTPVDELKKMISRALGKEVRELGVATGRLLYENQLLDMAYLRVNTSDNEEYLLEIYRESGTAITNLATPEAHKNIVVILKTLYPGLKMPRTRIIGF